MQPLGAGGLALANSLAVTAEVLVLLAILRRRWGGVEGTETLSTLGRVVLASLVMGAAIVAVVALAEQAGLGTLTTVAVAAVTGLAVYLLAGLVVGVRELRLLPSALLGK